LELWAGVECSVVRVGDTYVDQIASTGHDRRLGDLRRLASLGVRTVRYPILWERTAPDPNRPPDWTFADQRLATLRRLELRPVVGLVHHGSGPRHTSLLDASFEDGLAEFARSVAERFPWVVDYTPVNEPLTTARFACLYGHWHPHLRDDRSFARAVVIQCRAIRAAMQAIRRVVPWARLVQTEDIGTIFSTPGLGYQARFENERRFLTLDLLSGRVGRDHPLRGWLVGCGIDDKELESFGDEPCRPDIVGLNYYVTSDRFLDDRTMRYPPHVRGGNGRDSYADVEAVRVRGAGIAGHRGLIDALWERYRTTLAVTEVHLGCSPEEQARWLWEAWRAAKEASRAGVDIRAVTVWSAFGAFDWDNLLTSVRGRYEGGPFVVDGPRVRRTLLADVANDLARHGRSEHPALASVGWWRRPERLLYPSFGRVEGRELESVGEAHAAALRRE
jgi:dTDP-4-dehydrorhamnose reductase